MKTRDYVFALLLLVCSAITISLLMKSCKLSEAEQVKNEIKTDEDSIRAIQAKRDSANIKLIPFSDGGRDSVVQSVNDKNGFDLSVRPKGRD